MTFRIKRTLQPYVVGDKIKFGFGNLGLEREVEFNDFNEKLIKKLDKFPDSDFSREELEVIATFKDKGLLTDNKYDDTKFSRNINFFEWLDLTDNLSPSVYQEKLSKETILIVGTGGIGSTVAEILARLGIGHLILVDFDTVEDSNLTRQSGFSCEDVGKKKVEVLADYISAISETKVTPLIRKIGDKESLERVFREYNFSVSLCCADTPKIEIDYWFDDLSHLYSRPFISGSYASTVINYLYIIPGQTRSLRDFYGSEIITDDTLLDRVAPTSVIAPISFMSASMISFKLFSVLTGLVSLPHCLQIDCVNWEVYRFEV